jgi:hypothetical protein
LGEAGLVVPVDLGKEIIVTSLEILDLKISVSLVEVLRSGNVRNILVLSWLKVPTTFDEEHPGIRVVVLSTTGDHSLAELGNGESMGARSVDKEVEKTPSTLMWFERILKGILIFTNLNSREEVIQVFEVHPEKAIVCVLDI